MSKKKDSDFDWNKARAEVVDRLDVLSEYKAWGFNPKTDPSAKGWVDGTAIGREDNNPSAGVCISGKQKGAYKDNGGDTEYLTFYYAAVKFGGFKSRDDALRHYGEKVGVPIPAPSNEAFTPIPFSLPHQISFERSNPGVKALSVEDFGGYAALWNHCKIAGNKQAVIVVPIFDERGNCGNVLLPAVGKTILVPQKDGDAREHKKYTTPRSKAGWINQHAMKLLLATPRVVEVVWKVEGITDALALHGRIPPELRERHIVITNAGGAGQYPDKTLRTLLRGLRVYVIHDADKAGEAGAEKWVKVLGQLNCGGGHVRLPYVIEESHGADLRDWFNEGKSYDDLLALTGEAVKFPTGGVEDVDFAEVDSITVNSKQLHVITNEALASLKKFNTPPTLFTRDGTLTQCVDGKDGLKLARLGENEVRERLSRTARWVKRTNTGDDDVFPPKDVCSNILACPSLPFPRVQGVATAPMFCEKGNVSIDRGYSDATEFYNDFDAEIAIGDPPTKEEVRDAVDLVVNELLYDFPFHDDGSRAGAIEFFLRPYARLLIEGPTPLTLIHAPTERTGKGLLVKVLTMPFLGRPPAMASLPQEDEEIRKRITSNLSTGRPIFILDNLPDKRLIDSASLAVLLTSYPTWEDRILGATKMVYLPATAIWAATGNNPRLSPELCGRSVSVRLLSIMEDPSQRKGFKHPDILDWVKQNRWALVDAAITMIRAWIHEGRPQGAVTLGGFENWAKVMGGILDVAGVPGLLSNRSDFMDMSNQQAGDWHAFVKVWWAAYQGKPVTVSELAQIADQTDTMTDVLGDGTPRSQATKLGKVMLRMVDRVIGSKMIVNYRQTQTSAKMYRLIDPVSLKAIVSGEVQDVDNPDEVVIFQ